ncbi:heterokaryon incompatibility protein-domain-containing protein [Trametes gibbosa]|nr:heterokaryon incompatibility protein-domain-containing protein [Trametes gibbosa]
MRLLDTTTYQLYFVQDPSQTAYAILSHVWDPRGEQTFQDVQAIHATARSTFEVVPADDDPELLEAIRSRLSSKIRCCCDYARAKGFSGLWIDACCIDKTSSAELSEAINSMFDWYSLAEVCYVYLADVSDTDNPHGRASQFRWSRWFTRGWTLQELIVPWGIVFLSKEWRMIGTKASLASVIEEATGIDRDVLLRARPLHTVSVAQRMSWAARRYTTRVEDEAYCLMGIFGVRFAVIYGEGSQAFIRLQEEILKRVPDQSIFAWGLQLPLDAVTPDTPLPILRRVPTDTLRASKGAYLLAGCPADFAHSAQFLSIPFGTFSTRLGIPPSAPPLCLSTSHGIRTTFPVHTIRFPSTDGASIDVQLALLPCEDSSGRLLALILSGQDATWEHFTSGYDGENGFYWLFNGTVRPAPPSDNDFPPPPSCKKSITHSEWIRGARAKNFRHSKQYPRIALLDALMVSAWASGTPSAAPAMREICIPFHRLQTQSALAVYGPRPAWIDRGLVGECKLILPTWTLHHFRKLGVTVEGLTKFQAKEDNAHGRVKDLASAARRFASHFNLKLFHADTETVVTIMVFTCPTEPRGPLHASVCWTKLSHTRHNSPAECLSQNTEVPTECDGHHINAWKDGEKCHHGPTDTEFPSVTLQFSIWDADELSGVGLGHPGYGYYALNVTLKFPMTASGGNNRTEGSDSEWTSDLGSECSV